MPISRHLKHPIALWIIDSRNAMQPPMKPADVAQRIGVQADTVRAWEAARAGQNTRLPSPDNIEKMARLFGRPAPVGRAEGSNIGDGQAAVAAAIDRQTEVLRQLLEEFRLSRVAQETVAEGVGELAGLVGERLPLAGTPTGRAASDAAGTRR